ncbi:hypothetical protein RUM43_009602 [Polyplax serrata]|uniref:Ig-like domain-containing protein n=1 Tax=Polyplax serrata TaxID=468196 RepID=A0AAN8RUI8_POLSC
MWKNSSNTLWVDTTRMKQDDRLMKHRNNTLVIRRVNMHDSGQYTCQVVAEDIIQVTHTLNVVSEYDLRYPSFPIVEFGQLTVIATYLLSRRKTVHFTSPAGSPSWAKQNPP